MPYMLAGRKMNTNEWELVDILPNDDGDKVLNTFGAIICANALVHSEIPIDGSLYAEVHMVDANTGDDSSGHFTRPVQERLHLGAW